VLVELLLGQININLSVHLFYNLFLGVLPIVKLEVFDVKGGVFYKLGSYFTSQNVFGLGNWKYIAVFN